MRYGAKGGKWAPMQSEGTTAMKPTYGEVLEFDGINEFDETLNMATGSAYGDNQEKIYISEFSNGEGAVKAVYIPIKLSQAILGTQGNDKGSTYRTDDNNALGAYGFYRTLMDSKKNKFYEVNFYPKVQGTVEGSNAKSKEDGVTLEYDAIKFRILACNRGDYKIDQRFDKEDDAIAYLAGLFAGTAAWPDEAAVTPPVQGGEEPGGDSGTGTGGEVTEPEVTA